jgi:hypothetical protein
MFCKAVGLAVCITIAPIPSYGRASPVVVHPATCSQARANQLFPDCFRRTTACNAFAFRRNCHS